MTALDVAVLIVLGVVTIWRIPSALRDYKQRALWATFMFWLFARVLSIPSVATAVDSVSSAGSLSLLGKHLLGVASSVGALRFIATISGQEGIGSWSGRRRVALATGVSVVLCLLFVLTPDAIHGSLELLNIQQRQSLMTVGYWIVLEGYIGWALATAAVLFLRVGKQASGRWLRYGSVVVAVGALLDLVYAVVLVGLLVLRLFGVYLELGFLRQPMSVLQLLSILMMVAGTCVPTVGAMSAAVHRIRQYRRLLPLWRTLTEEFPDIVLRDGLGAGLWRWANIRLSLYRRVIEIRDGMLSVRAYMPEDGRARAEEWVAQADLPAEEVDAAVEACCLSLAMLARKRGLPEADHNTEPRRGGAQLDDEVRWLLMVNNAYNTRLAMDFGPAVLGEESGPPTVSGPNPSPAPTPSESYP